MAWFLGLSGKESEATGMPSIVMRVTDHQDVRHVKSGPASRNDAGRQVVPRSGTNLRFSHPMFTLEG
jgi:hypothetical protein